MHLRTVSFLALVFTALALIPSGAHLLALPNKIGLPEDQYFIVQGIYRGWALFGFILFPALLLDLVLAFLLRGERAALLQALAACVCLAATLAIFFSFTDPANVATDNWTVFPANWAALRTQWEYSHAVNAVLTFVAFCLVVRASLPPRA